MTDYLEKTVIDELREGYGEFFSERETHLTAALEKIYAKTGKKFIFLIDEWDCIIRERQAAEALQKQYLDFLQNLLKDQPYVALAYMTGILPVKKYGLHSALNMFWEFSMTDQGFFEEYTGFTEKEVQKLCEKYSMDFAEAGSWYDGYQFTEFRHVYNPKSVVEAMLRRKFSNYWTSTETYDALKLTLLIHLGYLAYDSAREEAFIPNREIILEFENAMGAGGWAEVVSVLKASEKLLEDTLRCDEKSVFLPRPFCKKPALLIELKYDKSADSAIRQIKDRQYLQALEGYSGEILLVGVNYDKESRNKPHSCIIEKFMA